MFPRRSSGPGSGSGGDRRPRLPTGSDRPRPRVASAHSGLNRSDGGRGRGGARGHFGSRQDLNTARRDGDDTHRHRDDRPARSSHNNGEGGRGRGGGRGGHGPRGRGRSDGEKRDHTPKPMTYGRLKTWAGMEDAGQLVLFMTSERQQLEIFFSQDTIKEDWITLFVTAVNHAMTAEHHKESVSHLLDILCTSRFFEHLTRYVTEKQIYDSDWLDAEEFFRSIICICEGILDRLPQYTMKCITITTQLLNLAPSFETVRGDIDLLKSLTSLVEKSKDVYKSEKEREKSSYGSRLFKGNDSEKPPDNFKDLSIVPTKFDLREDSKPFLRPVKAEGAYDDVEHYLDVQFRLMKQDFTLPLREGILDFKKNGCKKNFNSSDLRLYYDVHLVGTVFKDGIDHILQFDVSKLKSVKWEFSKRLIFGSLLCLSKDNFETVAFATVAHRDAKDLAKGNVNVSFKSGLDIIFNSTSNDAFVMAETTAYFESYVHVLEGLQEMLGKLPLQDYIVKCKKTLQPPKHLLPTGGCVGLPVYDLSCLLKDKDKSAQTKFPVLTTVRWPKSDEMCLNESQREAAQLALTKELAIIQGPPGTGKTYVGLKIMQVLLKNQAAMGGNAENSKDPILVVCYTNHALDQFLEGILEFCPEGIIRVGGRNKNEKLEDFNLRNIKQKAKREKSLSVRKTLYECISAIELVTEEIKTLNKTMDSLETDIQTEVILENYMRNAHFDSLQKSHTESHKGKGGQMRRWLNASSDSPQSVVPQMIQRHLTNLVLNWKGINTKGTYWDNMSIADRAGLYNYFRYLYKQSLHQKLSFYSQSGHGTFLPVSAEIKSWLSFADEDILPDSQLAQVFPEEIFSRIYQSLKRANKNNIIMPGRVIEWWLLGLHRSLHDQLDDVQTFTNFLAGENGETEDFDDVEASAQAQNDRIIDDDEDDDEDGGETYTQKTQAAKNRFTSVIQRAYMLGISEDILDTEVDEKEDDWKTVSRTKPLSFRKIQKKLKSIKPMSEEEAREIVDVWSLKTNQRFALYNLWLEKYKETLTNKMEKLVLQYEQAYNRKKEANREEILSLLRDAKVIGMTTTGAAKHRAVLQAVGCRIIVVEEAAEVLESHIVTALNKQCNHLILIGDHQQLRPNPTVYELAKRYGLEISLFERMIKNGVPHVLLKEQHRMRPEIAKLMRHIYPELCDHSSVHKYDNIRGVAKNIFLIQHQHEESRVDDTRSRANKHEADYIVALCQHFLQQGYDASQITILATYTGQVFEIKKSMKAEKFDHKVRVTAVDNFQGEENDIILLSLVRSNTQNSVGFLKVDNRVCVALSRAKKGLYVIGNFELLESQSKLWGKIIATARMNDFIGESLPVICQNHPEFKEFICSAEDFKKCPEGGCGKPCQYRLTCGHVCAKKCHGYDPEHEEYKCHKPCPKKCPEGHPCSRKCHQECGNCLTPIPKEIPVCGHKDDVPCHLAPIKATCSQTCQHMLPCEHPCSGKCGVCRKNGKHAKCTVSVEYVWPCGHISKVPCYMKPAEYPCQKDCGAVLDCGHKCVGKCSDCLQGAVHLGCRKKCDQVLPCGHTCSSLCGVPCVPCTQPCPSECRHAKCYKGKSTPKCGHFCPPCIERCIHGCQHKKCGGVCSEECSIDICNQRCTKTLKCNHKCSGLCGEICVCIVCGKISPVPSVRQEQVSDDESKSVTTADEDMVSSQGTENDGSQDDEEKKKKKKKKTERKKKDDRPVLKLPSCNHIFYVDELDKYVENINPQGTSFIGCPVCSKPIQKCWRYETINKRRSKQRETDKAVLRKDNEVTPQEIAELEQSQSKLENSVLLSYFRSSNLSQIENRNVLKAISFQLKCAFMLSEISTLESTEHDSAAASQLLRSRKDAVMKIKDNLTDQQKTEFTTELLRYFWHVYLSHLERLQELHDILIPENLANQVKKSKEDMSQKRPDANTLDRAGNVASILRRRIDEMSSEATVKAKCLLLEQMSIRAPKVLKSKDDEMLYDLVTSESTLGATRDDVRKETLRTLKESLKERQRLDAASRAGDRPLPFRRTSASSRMTELGLQQRSTRTTPLRPRPRVTSVDYEATQAYRDARERARDKSPAGAVAGRRSLDDGFTESDSDDQEKVHDERLSYLDSD